MLISVVNHTAGKLTDEKVQEGVRAVNRQIAHDFNPYWHLGAELRLEGALGRIRIRSYCRSCGATRSFTSGTKSMWMRLLDITRRMPPGSRSGSFSRNSSKNLMNRGLSRFHMKRWS